METVVSFVRVNCRTVNDIVPAYTEKRAEEESENFLTVFTAGEEVAEVTVNCLLKSNRTGLGSVLNWELWSEMV